jgi:hypothetical protein
VIQPAFVAPVDTYATLLLAQALTTQTVPRTALEPPA